MTTGPPIRVGYAGNPLAPALLAAFRLAPDITLLIEPLELRRLTVEARRQRPDVVVVDLGSAEGSADGSVSDSADEALGAMAAMMAELPTPILALYDPTGPGDPAGAALRVGAVEAMARPTSWTVADTAAVCGRIRVLRGVAVLRRRRPAQPPVGRSRRGRLIAIGASTGGPGALATVLAGLEGILSPILIVQHLRPEFLRDFVEWLGRNAAVPIELAQDRSALLDGVGYLAPTGVHMRVDDRRSIVLAATPPALHRPSVDQLFHSVAAVVGSDAVGVLLTGMGSDGAAGLLAMRRRGAVTIAQDEATSAVFGMPKAAQLLGAVGSQLPLGEIGAAIQAATRQVPV